MLLPEDNRELVSVARRLRLALERGSLAGRIMYRIRQRMPGRGERAGLRPFGRVEDFNLMESLVTRKPKFRRLVVAPHRPVNMCIDLSALADGPNAQRLLAAAILLGAAVLDMKSTSLTITAMGASSPVIPFSFAGLGCVGTLKKMVSSLVHAKPGLRANVGQLQRAALAVPEAHVLLVTHYFDPSIAERIAFPGGATVIALEPRDDGWSNAFGLSGGVRGMFGSDAVREALELRYADAAERLRKQRINHAVVSGSGALTDAMLHALGKNSH